MNVLGAKLRQTQPRHDFTAPDGIRHTVWHIPGGEEWIKAFADIPVAYIADGHHRAASAARVARLRRERNPQHTGEEDYELVSSAFCLPAARLKISPLQPDRLSDLNGLSNARNSWRRSVAFSVWRKTHSLPRMPGDGSACTSAGYQYGLRCPVDPKADPVARLDVSVLQEKLFGSGPLGIEDVRTSKRIEFVGGIRGTSELVKRIDARGRSRVFDVPGDGLPIDGYFRRGPDHAA